MENSIRDLAIGIMQADEGQPTRALQNDVLGEIADAIREVFECSLEDAIDHIRVYIDMQQAIIDDEEDED